MTTLQCLHTSSRVGIHGNLGTSCSIYAFDSSRTIPLVEEVLRQNVIHFSRIPM
jgi:hypothetical protein